MDSLRAGKVLQESEREELKRAETFTQNRTDLRTMWREAGLKWEEEAGLKWEEAGLKRKETGESDG